jgi:hypothetical protein
MEGTSSYLNSKLNEELAKLQDLHYTLDGGEVYVDCMLYDPLHDWSHAGPLKERLVIGSEGASAWGWSNGICIGSIGSTELEAICKTAKMLLKYKRAAICR